MGHFLSAVEWPRHGSPGLLDRVNRGRHGMLVDKLPIRRIDGEASEREYPDEVIHFAFGAGVNGSACGVPLVLYACEIAPRAVWTPPAITEGSGVPVAYEM
jgi:hypothetical protein